MCNISNFYNWHLKLGNATRVALHLFTIIGNFVSVFAHIPSRMYSGDLLVYTMKSTFHYSEVGNIEVGSGYNSMGDIAFNPMDWNIGNNCEQDNDCYGASLGRTLNEPSSGKRGTVLSSYFNLTNTILGASVLGMPYTFSQTGWAIGTLLMFVCGASSAFALHTLSLCAMKLNEQEEDEISRSDEPKKFVGATFYSVARASLPKYTLAIDIAILLKCFGVSISYLLVVSDLMPLVAENCGAKGVWLGRRLWVVVGFCSVAPSCFLKDLTSLSVISSFSLVFVGFFALLVCLYGMGIEGFEPCDGTEQCQGPIVPVVMSTHALKAMPIFVFGFTCQQVKLRSFPNIYRELHSHCRCLFVSSEHVHCV